MKQVNHNFTYFEYSSIDELNVEEQSLINNAIQIAKGAYAPYSGFNVGCAVLLDNDEVVVGSNQENAAYPSGLCAERVALFSAGALYPSANILAIAVVAMKDGELVQSVTAPCGACRQVIIESEYRSKSKFPVILAGKNKIIKFESGQDLLPLSFGPKDLE